MYKGSKEWYLDATSRLDEHIAGMNAIKNLPDCILLESCFEESLYPAANRYYQNKVKELQAIKKNYLK